MGTRMTFSSNENGWNVLGAHTLHMETPAIVLHVSNDVGCHGFNASWSVAAQGVQDLCPKRNHRKDQACRLGGSLCQNRHSITSPDIDCITSGSILMPVCHFFKSIFCAVPSCFMMRSI